MVSVVAHPVNYSAVESNSVRQISFISMDPAVVSSILSQTLEMPDNRTLEQIKWLYTISIMGHSPITGTRQVDVKSGHPSVVCNLYPAAYINS